MHGIMLVTPELASVRFRYAPIYISSDLKKDTIVLTVSYSPGAFLGEEHSQLHLSIAGSRDMSGGTIIRDHGGELMIFSDVV